jgi:cation transport regulator
VTVARWTGEVAEDGVVFLRGGELVGGLSGWDFFVYASGFRNQRGARLIVCVLRGLKQCPGSVKKTKGNARGGESVPYENLTDLPDSVRNNLPKHAQEIYRAAFNLAEDQYGEESRAHRVAWAAVEKKYEKNENGDWVEK